jgi:hypothetical protein
MTQYDRFLELPLFGLFSEPLQDAVIDWLHFEPLNTKIEVLNQTLNGL